MGMGRTMKHILALTIIPLLLAACSVPSQRGGGGGEEAGDSDVRVAVEAYSFNSRVWRDGKPTTFKLEVYQTDSLLGLSGKGYLGKGALKGRLTADSLEVYFPASDEYLYQSLDELLANGDCPLPLADINILTLFTSLPDSLPLDTSLSIGSNYNDKDRPEFRVSKDGCPWKLHVVYDRKERGWRIREFDFNDGKSTRLRGRIDKYKADAAVRLNRLTVAPPPEAVRITP